MIAVSMCWITQLETMKEVDVGGSGEQSRSQAMQ